MADQPPVPIDRAALERIMQRAAELQTSEHETGDAMTPDEVISLGREVGIPGRYLQQAMLEERTRATLQHPSGLLDRMVGPGMVGAQRVVQGTVDDVQRKLVTWVEEHELLCIQRQQPGRVTWEPIGGMAAAIRRSTAALSRNRRPFMLDKVDVLAASVTPLESGFVHVALTAEVRKLRGAYVGGAAAAASTGVAGTTVLLALGAFAPVALALLPVAGGVAWGVLRSARPKLERVVLGLERVLDELQSGQPRRALPRQGIVGLLADEVRRAIGDGSSWG